MTDNVIPFAKRAPLNIEHGVNHPLQGTVTLKFNRPLTEAEWRFFRETCERTAFMMRGVDFK